MLQKHVNAAGFALLQEIQTSLNHSNQSDHQCRHEHDCHDKGRRVMNGLGHEKGEKTRRKVKVSKIVNVSVIVLRSTIHSSHQFLQSNNPKNRNNPNKNRMNNHLPSVEIPCAYSNEINRKGKCIKKID